MRKVISLLRSSQGSSKPRGFRVLLWAWIAMVATAAPLAAQAPNNAPPGNNFQNAPAAPFGAPAGGVLAGGPDQAAQRGASANADFDSLIDLIVSTVATETWAENGGGEAEVRPFPTGVLVDAAGVLRLTTSRAANVDLSEVRGAAPRSESSANTENRALQASELRYISLPRLEREIARRQAAKEPLDPAMLTLAGLRRARYVFVYPETGDVVLAGPAGDWRVEADGRIVSVDTGEPVVRLDDLLVLLRRGAHSADSYFGCSINPRQEALAKTQAFLASTSARPLEPNQRKQWLGDLRDHVGTQDIEIFGVDPTSRLAGVLVAADYHMKLIGMGLEDGVDSVKSYLDSVRLENGSVPPMSVLRWWFALDYDTIRSSAELDAFELVGQGVRVLSENEWLAAQGQRVHTGQSEPLNRQFAEAFTKHFAELATKYPVYAELRNVFDLAMAVAIIEKEGLAKRAGWQPELFTDGERLRLPAGPVPRQVDTVINHRVINRRHIVAGVSGGVMVAPRDVLRKNSGTEATIAALTTRRGAMQSNDSDGTWWWDAE